MFGPPLPLTAVSTWTWIDHPVSGLLRLTSFALLRLGFPSAPYLEYLTLPADATRRTVLQKVRGCTFNSASTACKHRVSGSLSLRSRGSFHLSFTVLCSIGHWVVFSLRGWSPCLPTRFLVSRCTLDSAGYFRISDTWLSHSFAGLPRPFSYPIFAFCSPNPTVLLPWFRLFRFRSPLLPKSLLFSLPRPT